jgi:FKBP-type peptidyl-prolyl cis-trans isomerase SlyD
MEISRNRVVTIRYIMKNERGEVLEDTMASGPSASYLHGGAGILLSLQAQLEGMTPGDRKMVSLLQERDQIPGGYHFDVWVEQVREASREEQILGYPLTGSAMECAPGCICYY